MIGTLARKELHQHWHAFGLLVLLTFGAMGVVAGAAQFGGLSGSIFEGLRMILYTIVPLACLVLSHRLVALEFRDKTQLFLEALPVSRWRMVALKYLFGCAVIFFLVAGALAISAIFGRTSELLTPRFLAILAARSLAWTWFFYNLLFLFGFLGRYRFVFGLFLYFGYLALDALTDVRISEWGPFALLNERFAFESHEFPVAALRTTALLALGLMGLSLGLGLAREGSVAALLGERMSHREKMFCTGLVIAGLALFGTAAERTLKVPYDLPGAIEEARSGVVVKVASAGDKRATELAARLADQLASVRDYLAVSELPPVFIVARPKFRPDQFERIKLEDEQGVLVGANFAALDFHERAFAMWLLREVLKARTFDRAEREPSKWVLDGFPLFWASRAEVATPVASAATLHEGARRAASKGFSPADVEQWLSFQKRVGAEDASAVAWAGLRTLARRHGENACRDFLRDVLGGDIRHDARAVARDLRDPIRRRLQRAARVSPTQFHAEWCAEIAS